MLFHSLVEFLVYIVTLLSISKIKNLKQVSIATEAGLSLAWSDMSRDVRKPDFCICESKDADQLRGDREADQRLCFRYADSRIPLLPKSEISSL